MDSEGTEMTVDRSKDTERIAERRLSVEEFVSTNVDDEPDSKHTLDLDVRSRLSFRSDDEVRQAPVIDVRSNSSTVEIDAQPYPDETVTFRLSTRSDRGESQVKRFCRQSDTPVDRFADLYSVRILRSPEGEWVLPLEPGVRTREFAVSRRGEESSIETPFVTDRVRLAFHRMTQWALEHTPAFTPPKRPFEHAYPRFGVIVSVWILPPIALALAPGGGPASLIYTLLFGLVLMSTQWGNTVEGEK